MVSYGYSIVMLCFHSQCLCFTLSSDPTWFAMVTQTLACFSFTAHLEISLGSLQCIPLTSQLGY